MTTFKVLGLTNMMSRQIILTDWGVVNEIVYVTNME